MYLQGGIEVLLKAQNPNPVNFVEECEHPLSPKSW